MTDSERQQILKMIEEGKITAAEGLRLMQALAEEDPDEPELSLPPEPASEFFTETEEEKSRREAFFAAKLGRFRRLWVLPFSIGLLFTVFSAMWMSYALQTGGLGFWFYFSALPFALGVAIVALSLSSRDSRWVYVNIHQKPGESPARLAFGFPTGLITGLLSLFSGFIPAEERGKVDMVMNAFNQSISADAPVLVDVDDKDGEKVQVYIG